MESRGRTGENGPRSGRAWYDYVNDWFAADAGPHENPKQVVQPFLLQNFAALGVGDPEVEVLVVENQGVWLWGRRHRDGVFLERQNEAGEPWMHLAEDELDWLDALGCQWEQDSRPSPPNP